MTESTELTEKELRSEKVYSGCMLQAYRDEIQLPNGSRSVREYLKHVGAVCVLPLDEDGQVYMERQYRYPVGRVVFELPAGKLNSAEEDRLLAAKRELEEETGLSGSEWIYLGDYMPAPAYCTELISLYLCRDLTQGERHLDEDEFLNVEKVPLSLLLDMVLRGEITDGKTQVAVMKASLYLETETGPLES